MLRTGRVRWVPAIDGQAQFRKHVRVAKGRDWVRRLVPALMLGCLAAVFSIDAVLADTAAVAVAPTAGLPAASFTVDGTYTWTNGCPALAPVPLSFNFFWDNNPNAPIWSVTTSTCTKNVTDTGLSKPYTAPAALATVGSHTVALNVLDSSGKQLNSARAVYTITAPPPPPSPSPSPSPSPAPSPSPSPSATPSTAPPPTPSTAPRPTPLQAPPSPPLSSALPSSTPSSAPPAPPSVAACLVGRITPLAAPRGGDGAVAFAAILAGSIPIGAVAFVLSPSDWRSRRRLAQLAALFGLAVLLAMTDCGRPVTHTSAPIHAVVSPTSACPSPAA